MIFNVEILNREFKIIKIITFSACFCPQVSVAQSWKPESVGQFINCCGITFIKWQFDIQQ